MATIAMSQQMTLLESRLRDRRARFARRAQFSPGASTRLASIAIDLAGLASFAYAVAVCLGSPVPRLRAPISTPAAIAIDALLLIALAMHFHFIGRPGAKRAPPPSTAMLQVAVLVALFVGLWQALPMPVWTVTATPVVAMLWLGYAVGWGLLLLRAQRPACLVAGVVLVEWSAPTLSLGHLVFAIGLTAFVVAYRESLAGLLRMPATGRGRR